LIPLCINNIVLIVFLESVRKYTPNVAKRCTMQQKDCNAIIGLWTVGSAGENTKGAINNGQSRETGNIGYARHKMRCNVNIWMSTKGNIVQSVHLINNE
jgi:hypothetical protein